MKNTDSVAAQPGYFVCENIKDSNKKHVMGFNYNPVVAWAINYGPEFTWAEPVCAAVYTEYVFMKYPCGGYFTEDGCGPFTYDEAQEVMMAHYNPRA